MPMPMRSSSRCWSSSGSDTFWICRPSSARPSSAKQRLRALAHRRRQLGLVRRHVEERHAALAEVVAERVTSGGAELALEVADQVALARARDVLVETAGAAMR